MRTSDGYYISENNQFKSFSSGLQNGGDAMVYGGLGASITVWGAPIGGVAMSVGGAMNFIGTGIEFGYLLSQGKKGEAWTKLGMSAAFMGTGKLGLMAVERAVGSSLNTATKTL